ncbi:MAG TPA: tRNA (adenine-N(6)-)-methyltransferase [Bacteroidales bacterium]|nr:tRNA (adenine-N(6)-)-methyltransferase [Bacteroidales bacterium]
MKYFDFKQFRINQERSAFKVGTDGVLLGAWADASSAGNILDIGTGTGLLALMLGQRTECDIVAVEADKTSYEEALLNVNNSPWHKRIRLVNTSIQDYLPARTFDLIVSNPPFFSNSLKNKDERLGRARHDINLNPRDLLKAVERLLSGEGTFCLVLPYTGAALFIADASEFGLYCNKMLKVKPLPSSPVKRILMEFSRVKKEMHQSFLTIESGKRHQYTVAYKKLTSAYYLNF